MASRFVMVRPSFVAWRLVRSSARLSPAAWAGPMEDCEHGQPACPPRARAPLGGRRAPGRTKRNRWAP